MAASVNALRPRDTIERWTILSFSFPVSFFFFLEIMVTCFCLFLVVFSMFRKKVPRRFVENRLLRMPFVLLGMAEKMCVWNLRRNVREFYVHGGCYAGGCGCNGNKVNARE